MELVLRFSSIKINFILKLIIIIIIIIIIIMVIIDTKIQLNSFSFLDQQVQPL